MINDKTYCLYIKVFLIFFMPLAVNMYGHTDCID